ncbi:MAG: YciI family protein [Acidimicrobiia bacterium]
MANYLLAYHGGGMPETPEQQAEVMAAWEAWYGTLGASIVDGGAPTMPTTTVAADGSTSATANPVSGYTIVSADSLDDALAKAAGCPIRDAGGSIEVGELMPM